MFVGEFRALNFPSLVSCYSFCCQTGVMFGPCVCPSVRLSFPSHMAPPRGGGGSDWSVWGQPGLGHLAFRSLVGGGVADQRHRVLVLSAELWFEDCGTTFGI